MKQEIDITTELRVHIARNYKNQTAAAAAWAVSPAFVSAVLLGKKKPTATMLRDAGFELVQSPPSYVRIKGKS